MPWPNDPEGDLTPILKASIEAAKARHPSGKMRGKTMSEPYGDLPRGGGVKLTIADRCDRCNAAAAFRVWLAAFGDLDFCLHHFQKNFPPMADQGWAVVGGNPDVIPPKR